MSMLRSVVQAIPMPSSCFLLGLLSLGPCAVAQSPVAVGPVAVGPVAAGPDAGAGAGSSAGRAAAQQGSAPAQQGSAPQQPVAGPVIGVVDVIKAVEQYPRYIELRNALQERVRAYQEQLKLLAQQLDELRATIPVLEDPSDRAEKEFELQMGLQRQDFLRKMFQERMQLEDLRNTLIVYEDLEVVIGKVAKARGVTLVLTKQDIDPSPTAITEMVGREVEARVKAFDRRNVWFVAEELDLTGDVIKMLMVPVEKPAAGAGGGDDKSGRSGGNDDRAPGSSAPGGSSRGGE